MPIVVKTKNKDLLIHKKSPVQIAQGFFYGFRCQVRPFNSNEISVAAT